MPDRRATIAATAKRFWPVLRPQRGKLWLAFAASLLASGLSVLSPMPVKIIIDDVLIGRQPNLALPPMSATDLILLLAGAAALFAAFSALFSATEKMISARIRERMTLDLRMICLDRLLLMTPLCRGDDRNGELALRLIDDVQQVARLFTKTAPVILRHGLTLLFALGALFWISPLLGAAATVIAAVLGAMVRFAAKPLRITAKAKRIREGRIAGQTQEILGALSFIQASGADDDIRARFAETNRQSLGAGVAETRAAVRLERTMQVANGIAVALIVGGGGWLALGGYVSAGDLAIAIIYLNQMLRPIEKINELVSAVTSATSRAVRLSELLDRDERIDRSGTHSVSRADGAIRLAAPMFSYVGGRTFHFNVIDIPARAFVSIEGPSGAGKSTLLALLARLFDPLSGAIMLDDTAYPEWDLINLRSQFAISPQSPPLMSGTVRDWMRLGGVTADDAQLWQALRSVSLAEMLKSRGGLDAPIGEAGAGLSGGEQARIALARAPVADRPILLLDEPFANVDPVSAKVMLNALAREKMQRTIIIVTHQALPSGFADIRLMMADGKLSVIGIHSEQRSA
jgi:ATP-binding cassette, subfamily B, bacterial